MGLPFRRARKEQTRIGRGHPRVRATGSRNKPEGKVLVENKERLVEESLRVSTENLGWGWEEERGHRGC